MGRLRAKTWYPNVTVNGVALGQPPITDINGVAPTPGDSLTADLYFIWDDSRFPNGVVNADGTVTLDPEPSL